MNKKPFFVMVATPSGENRVTETRFGRWFKSIDAAVKLAKNVGGSVYERRGTDHYLRLDAENQIKGAK